MSTSNLEEALREIVEIVDEIEETTRDRPIGEGYKDIRQIARDALIAEGDTEPRRPWSSNPNLIDPEVQAAAERRERIEG